MTLTKRWLTRSQGHNDVVFTCNHTPTTGIYTLSLHDALPIYAGRGHRPHPELARRERRQGRPHRPPGHRRDPGDRKSTRLNSSHVEISYADFCLKKKKPLSITYTPARVDLNARTGLGPSPLAA